MFLEILEYSQENTCTRVSVLIKLQASTFNFIKKEALAQMFSCEIREISKDTFFTAHLRATASVYTLIYIDKEFEFSSEILQSIWIFVYLRRDISQCTDKMPKERKFWTKVKTFLLRSIWNVLFFIFMLHMYMILVIPYIGYVYDISRSTANIKAK